MSRPRKIPQPMRPAGLGGRIFGHLMEWLAAPNYHWVIRQLGPGKPRSYLEVGFGTGRLMQLAAERFLPQRLYGVDLMALVSYDQVAHEDDNNWSLGYVTIVGAYFLKGTRHDISTLVDLAVVDPATHSLVCAPAASIPATAT